MSIRNFVLPFCFALLLPTLLYAEHAKEPAKGGEAKADVKAAEKKVDSAPKIWLIILSDETKAKMRSQSENSGSGGVRFCFRRGQIFENINFADPKTYSQGTLCCFNSYRLTPDGKLIVDFRKPGEAHRDKRSHNFHHNIKLVNGKFVEEEKPHADGSYDFCSGRPADGPMNKKLLEEVMGKHIEGVTEGQIEDLLALLGK